MRHPGGHVLLMVSFFFIEGLAFAQVSSPPTAGAEGGTNSALTKRGWDIRPNIGVDMTYTDNVSLAPQGGDSDLITRVSPGITIQGQSARAKGYVDFKLQQVNYAKSEGRDQLQHALSGSGTVELLDNWLYLDLSGRIAQQAISAFGTPSSGSTSINSNVVESSMYRYSPYVKGHVGASANYLLRFDNTQYSSRGGSSLQNTTIQSVQADLAGGSPLSKLSWGVSGSAQQVTYATNAKNETSALRGSLGYKVLPQLRMTLIGGQETNDYVNFQQQTSSISGWGVDWSPSERTQLSWTQEKRYFGDGHRFSFTHRTPQTALRLSDIRDVSIQAPQSLTYGRGTYYDLIDQQLLSQYPDPVARAIAVQILLQAAGIPPEAQVLGGYMSSRASLNRTREASFTITGTRNVVTFSAQSSERDALGTGVGLLPDDFTNFSTHIKQRGVNFNWAYKLTPTATFTFMGFKTQTSGNTSNLGTDRDSFSVMLSNKLGSRTSGSIGLRQTKVSGFVSYEENALLGSLLMTF